MPKHPEGHGDGRVHQAGGYTKYPAEGAPVTKHGGRGPLADGRKTSGPKGTYPRVMTPMSER